MNINTGTVEPTGLLLDGPGRRELREILLEAFSRQKLERALAEANPAREFSHIVSDKSFDDQVRELIDTAEHEGWLNQLEQVLANELPDRKDLKERFAVVLQAAKNNALNLGEEVSPLIAVRSRLLTTSCIGIMLGIAGIVLGVFAWSKHGSAAPLLLAALAFILTLAAGMLLVGSLSKDRVGDRLTAFAHSTLPIAGLALLAGLVVSNILYYWLGRSGGSPNFILKVVDELDGANKAVAEQPVYLHALVSPGEKEESVQRTTNLNGEAFFTLQLGTGTLYSGGVLIRNGEAWRDCLFPAFPALETRSVVQNVAALNCRVGRGSERGLPNPQTVLRVGNILTGMRSLTSEERSRLPLNEAERMQRAPLGVPDAPIVLDRHYYSLGYDPGRRVPLWAAFIVRGDEGAAPSKQAAFVADPELPSDVLSNTADYDGNPYSRGHLVSPEDARNAGLEAEREASYLAAVVPQAQETSRGVMAQLERLTHELAARAGPMYVLSGPIYEHGAPLVIGQGATPVPVALYRVLLRRAASGDWRALSFIMINDGSVMHFSPEDFIVPLSEVEERTGLIFFPNASVADSKELKSFTDLAAFSN